MWLSAERKCDHNDYDEFSGPLTVVAFDERCYVFSFVDFISKNVVVDAIGTRTCAVLWLQFEAFGQSDKINYEKSVRYDSHENGVRERSQETVVAIAMTTII
ncbi:uncharacterized protein ASCRUDRAFT_71037 [Ascoidea rubescens DSM 1968]|uniref:Uncharacterized protein n=1 Tax=Ascoidea rubescens DSM 1968 TaxID=1344418 RepID=A0A1D2VG29_9ASCO|nr:hypothetical protein ASCRUDRAFT_71037 [Ascoidea rubescens DSM 1968]ODV60549.1 hypothetical protein ASCRUDRAFT_71037 [Ascoidea rubescens DSM 1968]